jgi:hypothetical protein
MMVRKMPPFNKLGTYVRSLAMYNNSSIVVVGWLVGWLLRRVSHFFFLRIGATATSVYIFFMLFFVHTTYHHHDTCFSHNPHFSFYATAIPP